MFQMSHTIVALQIPLRCLLLVPRPLLRPTRLVHYFPMSHHASHDQSAPPRGNFRNDIASEAYGARWDDGRDGRIRGRGGRGRGRRASPDYGDNPRRRSHSPPHPGPPPPTSEQATSTPPRAPTPLPDPEPSEAYLAASLVASTPLSSPSALRKLLILDLNGSLLIRAPHRPTSQRRPGDARVRPVHPRPYMPAFRSFLFHAETRAWLDVMVWSSAQPHSVGSMVDMCFGAAKDALVAVWARDTLGLNEVQYSASSLHSPAHALTAADNKVQTLKDLTKPWTQLPLAGADEAQAHSAASTLLLDDSPAKARLQPHNHVCLREYDAGLRTTDLARLTWERAAGASSPPVSPPPSTSGEAEDRKPTKADKKRKRAAERAGAPPGAPFDATLLTIVGVLDALRTESNVAGWVRAGGLWGPYRAQAEAENGSPGKKARLEGDVPSASTEDGAPPASTEVIVPAASTADDAPPASQGTVPPESSPPPEPVPTGADEASSSAPAEDAKQPLWFDDARVVAHWEKRGRQACEALGIAVEHGLDR
jgi:hypothetical protein